MKRVLLAATLLFTPIVAFRADRAVASGYHSGSDSGRQDSPLPGRTIDHHPRREDRAIWQKLIPFDAFPSATASTSMNNSGCTTTNVLGGGLAMLTYLSWIAPTKSSLEHFVDVPILRCFLCESKRAVVSHLLRSPKKGAEADARKCTSDAYPLHANRRKNGETESSLPAFAFGDVVNAADSTDIRSITQWHSLSPSSVIRTAISLSCDVLSPAGSDVDLPCSARMTR